MTGWGQGWVDLLQERVRKGELSATVASCEAAVSASTGPSGCLVYFFTSFTADSLERLLHHINWWCWVPQRKNWPRTEDKTARTGDFPEQSGHLEAVCVHDGEQGPWNPGEDARAAQGCRRSCQESRH